MKLILRRAPTGATQMVLVPPTPAEEAAAALDRRAQKLSTPRLLPRAPRDPHAARAFSAWQERHAYYLDCMAAFVRRRIEGGGGGAPGARDETTVLGAAAGGWDWQGLRANLARFAYRTSRNRLRSFVLMR